jgi:hypothetical protein
MSDDIRHDHPRGGVAYQPTDEQRRMVKVMSGFGIPQPDIAAQIGIDAKTLRKHFREELDRGMTEANMRVAQSLFNMATTGGSVAAAIFWMKARSGWREKHEVEHTGDGVRSPQFVIYAGYPQGEELTPDAWAERYRPDGRASSTEGPPTITVPEIE